MSDRKDKTFIDDLVEQSLDRRREIEPLRGLEERLLARLRSPRQVWWAGWAWRLASALAALAVIAAVVGHRTRPPARRPVAQVSTPAPLAVPARLPRATPAKPLRAAPRRANHARPASMTAQSSEPRPNTFPTPTPLTEQERLLLRFVQAAPAQVLLATIREREEREAQWETEFNMPPLNAE